MTNIEVITYPLARIELEDGTVAMRTAEGYVTTKEITDEQYQEMVNSFERMDEISSTVRRNMTSALISNSEDN